jgi:histidine kinase/DNA gyrase B/HSP90-like ATPase/histidine kinase
LSGPVSQRPREHAWLPSAVVAGAVLAATLAVPFLPPLQFAYSAPGLHVALETGAALIGLLAAAIVVRGWGAGPRLDRLAISAGLAVMALTSAVLTTMLAVAPDSGPRGLIAVTGTCVGSALLAAGAFAPARRPAKPRVAVVAVVGITFLALLLVAGAIELALGERPAPAPGADLARPRIDGPFGVLVLQVVSIGCFAAAVVGLIRRGINSGDAFARRLGLAVTFFVFATVHYSLQPQMGAEWLHVGDVLRLLFCVVLLWAACGEVASMVAARAAERERRRIARDFHDGVAQELAFIRRRAARLAGQPDAAEIAGAAERALLDSRWAIEHLARPPDEPLDSVLSRHAGVIAARTGVAVTFSASGSAEAGPEVREALARILGEAVANAGHGRATRVHVELSGSPLRLRVIDDGTGFDPAANVAGFGLGGMRERAALVGAELSVRSGPGAGTEVAVELP